MSEVKDIRRSGRPETKEVPGTFVAQPIPNAKEEPFDEQTRDRLNRIPLEKRFEEVAARTLMWVDAIECADHEKEAGLNVILSKIYERLNDVDILVGVLESEMYIDDEIPPKVPPEPIVAGVYPDWWHNPRVRVENLIDREGYSAISVYVDKMHVTNIWRIWGEEQIEDSYRRVRQVLEAK